VAAEVPAEGVAPALPATAAVATPAPVARVEPYVLPACDLVAVAQAAGLEWVSSDADKVRAAQEAIASEPRPIRVPRERKPVVVVDEGPLVLVETRLDLSQMKLPFELGARH
jgi:ribonuclease E